MQLSCVCTIDRQTIHTLGVARVWLSSSCSTRHQQLVEASRGGEGLRGGGGREGEGGEERKRRSEEE